MRDLNTVPVPGLNKYWVGGVPRADNNFWYGVLPKSETDGLETQRHEDYFLNSIFGNELQCILMFDKEPENIDIDEIDKILGFVDRMYVTHYELDQYTVYFKDDNIPRKFNEMIHDMGAIGTKKGVLRVMSVEEYYEAHDDGKNKTATGIEITDKSPLFLGKNFMQFIVNKKLYPKISFLLFRHNVAHLNLYRSLSGVKRNVRLFQGTITNRINLHRTFNCVFN